MDPTDDLLADVLERPAHQWAEALAAVCGTHAAAAPELRRRFAVLQRMGVADGEAGLAAGSAAPFPERFGPYRLVSRLGGGGMGVVYVARHEQLDRDVALKLIRPERLYFDDARERFRREVEAVARLAHPGCVQIHQVGEAQGVPYFAMELVAGVSFERVVQGLAGQQPSKLGGQDLARILRQAARDGETTSSELLSGPWTRVCLRLVLAAAEALAHAHARGVVHRDVKPSNLMLTPEGRVVVIDFGLAVAEGRTRMTRSGAFLGSLPYMAPEQVRGDQKSIDARTDVYALGVCLYELLALVSPFESASAETTRDAILAGSALALRARNPAVSADVAVICGKAMDVDPRRRYQHMADFAADLAAVLEHRPIAARPAGLLDHTARWARRRPATSTALVLSAAALSVGPLVVSFAIAGQRDRAVEAERLALGRAYAANLAAANAALLAGNGQEAHRRLDACPTDHRGFEWRHLHQALDGALLTVRAHRARVTAVALAADGSKVASGAENGEIALFDARTGARALSLQPGDQGVTQLEFRPAAAELFAVSAGQLRVFDATTGGLRRERTIAVPGAKLLVLPGARAILCDHGAGRLTCVHPETLEETHEVVSEGGHEPPEGRFVSDGDWLVSSLRIGGLAVWDVRDGRLVRQVVLPHGVRSMCMAPGAARLAAADAGSQLTWVDVQAERVHRLDTGGRAVENLTMSRDGHLLTAGCSGGELLVFDLNENRLVRSLHGHRGPVLAAVSGTENALVLTGGSDGTLRLWSPSLAPDTLDLRGFGMGAGLATHGERVFFGNRESTLRCIDARTGSVVWRSQAPHWINSLALAGEGRVLVTSHHTVLLFFDAASGTRLGELALAGETGYLDEMVVGAGGLLFAGGQAGVVAAVDPVTRTLLASVRVHDGPVYGLAAHPASDTVVSAGRDGKLVAMRGRDLAQQQTLVAGGSPIHAIAFDGDTLLCSEKDALCRRDRTTGHVLQRRPCPTLLRSLVMLGDDRVVTGSDDGRIGFWDRRELELLLELKQPAQGVWRLAADDRARWLAVSTIGGDPRILYGQAAAAAGLTEQGPRARAAAARELATQETGRWPWSPAAERAIAERRELSAELREQAVAMLPPPGRWQVASPAILMGESPAAGVLRSADLVRYHEMLSEIASGSTDHPLHSFVCIALGLVCVRLGRPEQALSAVRNVTAADVGGNWAHWAFVRAWAHARLGQTAEAASALTELHDLGASGASDSALARAFAREIIEDAR